MSAGFIAHLCDLCADVAGGLGAVSTRAMFGGHGLYVDGRIVGFVVDDALYLKADAHSEPAFRAAGGAPFVYTGHRRPITMRYWSLPGDALDSAEALRPWLQRACEAAQRKAAAPRRTRPARR